MKTEKELEKMVENLMRQTAREPADDLYNKMGILNEFLESYAKQTAIEFAAQCISPFTTDDLEIIKVHLIKKYDGMD